MRILLLNQFYAPDPAPTGQLLADLAGRLAAEGHSVRVVCGRTPYGEAGLASYASFYLHALWRALGRPAPDLVVTLTTPPLLSLAGAALQLRGARHIIWEMDVYPDVAVAVGALRAGGLADRAIGALADFARRRADRIIALGPCMRDRLLARGIPGSKIRVAENWADGSLIRPRPWPPAPPLRMLYSGNLGRAHDVDTLAAALRALGGDPRFHFCFAGGGTRRHVLEMMRLPNVAFLPYQPRERLSEHFGRCHIGLVTQLPACLGAVVPSKTYALMAAGRPVIFIGPRDATPARLLDRFGCGWCVPTGEVSSLLSLLDLLAANPELVRQAGLRSRRAFHDHYDLATGTARVAALLGCAHHDGVVISTKCASIGNIEKGNETTCRPVPTVIG